MSAVSTAAVQAFLEEVLIEHGASPRNVFSVSRRLTPEVRSAPWPMFVHEYLGAEQSDAFGSPVIHRRQFRVEIQAEGLDEVIRLQETITRLAASRTGGRVRLSGDVGEIREAEGPLRFYGRSITLRVAAHAPTLLTPRTASTRLEYGAGRTIQYGDGRTIRYG